MSCLEQSLPVIIYFLVIILIIVLIAVLIRTFFLLHKVDRVVENVNEKMNSLEGLFSMIDNATDTFSIISDKVVGAISLGIRKIFRKKEEDENE